LSIVESRFSSVVLPLPDGPMMPRNSPSTTLRSKSSSAVCVAAPFEPAPYTLVRPLASSTADPAGSVVTEYLCPSASFMFVRALPGMRASSWRDAHARGPLDAIAYPYGHRHEPYVPVTSRPVAGWPAVSSNRCTPARPILTTAVVPPGTLDSIASSWPRRRHTSAARCSPIPVDAPNLRPLAPVK